MAALENIKSGKSEGVTLGRNEILAMIGNFFILSTESIILGLAVGLLCALLLKHVDLSYDPTKECTVMIMFAYGSYLCGEAFGFSGIITMFICGLVMAHYAYWNISKKARVGTELAITTISNIS